MYIKKLDLEKLTCIKKLEQELPAALLAVSCSQFDSGKDSGHHFKPALLAEEQLNKIAELEKNLGCCLYAVEKTGSLYVLEAKMAPNEWEKISKVYPTLQVKAYYPDRDSAHEVKSRLKRILANQAKLKIKKRPIRNRKIA